MDESAIVRIAKGKVDDQFTKVCNDRFITNDQLEVKMKSIWEFARSRAHKGLVGLVMLFLAALLMLSVRGAYVQGDYALTQSQAISKLDKGMSLTVQAVTIEQKHLKEAIARIDTTLNKVAKTINGGD